MALSGLGDSTVVHDGGRPRARCWSSPLRRSWPPDTSGSSAGVWRAGRACVAFAAIPGRASLSVYIGESVLLSLLFCGYGLGFFGEWGAFPVVLSGIAAWVVLALLARAWLRRFRQGPLEALLARWTGQRSAGPPRSRPA